ncbi:MAG: hypothetical protein VYB54_04705 [Pseudomonadota bacterium]|nr:hypothetical protein [Pseudomonadota bacterium]
MARKRGKIGARKRKHGPRQPNGRPREVTTRDDGTPALLRHRTLLVQHCIRECHAKRADCSLEHLRTVAMNACGHPLDMLHLRRDIGPSEKSAGEQYRRLYLACIGGIGAVAAGVRSPGPDDPEDHERFRRMQDRISLPGVMQEIHRVCVHDEWPGWMAGIRTSEDHARMTAFLAGIKALAA